MTLPTLLTHNLPILTALLRRRKARWILALSILCYLLYIYLPGSVAVDPLSRHGQESPKIPFPSRGSSSSGSKREKELVVASLKGDDTAWLKEFLPDWRANVYVVDDPEANLTVSRNKGRESMVYLTWVFFVVLSLLEDGKNGNLKEKLRRRWL